MNKFGLILSLTILLQFSSSLDLECSFNRNYYYSILGKIYRCEIEVNFEVESAEDAVVTSISGQHHAYVGDQNVTGLFAYSKDLKFMPKNVDRFFENIKLIDIVNSRIRNIHQKDLKPYPELVYCGFKDNEIQVLEAGLFDYNLELELVSFWNNRIIQVGSNVFDHLTKLTWLYFNDNSCLDMSVENNRIGVKNMIEKISQNCNSLNCLYSETSGGSRRDIEELKAQIYDLKATTQDLIEKNQKLEKDLTEAMKKINNLEMKFCLNESVSQNMDIKEARDKNMISQQYNESSE